MNTAVLSIDPATEAQTYLCRQMLSSSTACGVSNGLLHSRVVLELVGLFVFLDCFETGLAVSPRLEETCCVEQTGLYCAAFSLPASASRVLGLQV